MRYLNSFIPADLTTCKLDTLAKIHNLPTVGRSADSGTWGLTMDTASGYHNFGITSHQLHLMGIAIHAAELPPEAIENLRQTHPNCEDKSNVLFYFAMLALPFGLATSCAVFSDVVTALVAA